MSIVTMRPTQESNCPPLVYTMCYPLLLLAVTTLNLRGLFVTVLSPACKLKQVCASMGANPCKNNAKCMDTNQPGDGYKCIECPTGYRGKFCQINNNECDASPCANNGKCTDGVNTYTCDCTGTGFTGMCVVMCCTFKERFGAR